MDTVMKKEDYLWARLIWKEALQVSALPLSWGLDLSSITTVENGTEFGCLGLRMKGKVKIQHQGTTNTFRVTMTPENEETPILIENVLLQDLVCVINDSISHYHECHNTNRVDCAIAV